MLLRTHLVAALAAGLYFQSPSWQLLLALIISATVPDIDTPKSFLGKRLPIISYPLKFFVGHRTLFHAVWLPAALFFFLADFHSISLGILIGYGSHLLLDSLTRQGVQPFYPLKFRLRGPVETGGFFEGIFFILLVTADAFLVVKMF
ncbi:MAG: metal-dependent hydrolase [Candidatus Woesearchaeota archaeon]